jgi:hypothetical protein
MQVDQQSPLFLKQKNREVRTFAGMSESKKRRNLVLGINGCGTGTMLKKKKTWVLSLMFVVFLN